jgi:hypothetical protein
MSATTDHAESMTWAGAALEYAKRGLRVNLLQGVQDGVCACQRWRDKKGKGPCPTPGKHPRFTNWPEIATTDRAQIEKWFRQYPAYNVGIATGVASRIFVLDVDPRHGGEESLDSLIRHLRCTRAATVMTGTGWTASMLQFCPRPRGCWV